MSDSTLLNSNFVNQSIKSNDLDNLFANLNSDLENVNVFISNLNSKKQANIEQQRELDEEKHKLEQDKIQFENYMKLQKEDLFRKQNQLDQYIKSQKDTFSRTESELKDSYERAVMEVNIAKSELQLQQAKLEEEKRQFESYKSLELNKLQSSIQLLNSEKQQFEQYKKLDLQKMELENKKVEQKCARFKEIIGQINSNFMPIIENKE